MRAPVRTRETRTVITCPKCGKENQPHYKFCLGCGAELPRDGAPKPFVPNTPPGGVPKSPGVRPSAAPPTQAAPAMTGAPSVPPAPAQQSAPPAPMASAPPPQAAPLQQAPAAVQTAAPPDVAELSAHAASVAQVACAQCGHVNASNNMFCASCGFRLSGGAPAVSAAPAGPTVGNTGLPSIGGAQASSGAAAINVVLTALRADGSEAGSFVLAANISTIGRETGGIFAADSYLSPRHATFTIANNKLKVRDENSLNGVYVRLARDTPVELRPNDVFRIGQEIVKFEPLHFPEPSPDGVLRLGAPATGYVGRIALVIGRETNGNAFPVPETGVHMGRERGDVLFPEDGYVSGLHCRIAHENGKTYLTDLGSSNGTFLRLREELEVRSGEVLLMGQQLFRVSL